MALLFFYESSSDLFHQDIVGSKGSVQANFCLRDVLLK